MYALRADHAVSGSNISIEGITGCELRALKGHSAEVVSVPFSSDGQTLARGSFDHTIKLWVVAMTLSHFQYRAKVEKVGFEPERDLL